jgi:hypothetical protein
MLPQKSSFWNINNLFALACLAANAFAGPLAAQQSHTFTYAKDGSKGRAGLTFEAVLAGKGSGGYTGFTRVKDYAQIKSDLDSLSAKDYKFLETLSPLPPVATGIATAGVDYLPGSREFDLLKGPYRCLGDHAKTISNRRLKMLIDVITPEAERAEFWKNVTVPSSSLPPNLKNDFERRRATQTVIAELKQMKPLSFAKEVYIILYTQSRYDFERKGYRFSTQQSGRVMPYGLIREGKTVDPDGYLPMDEASAEKLLTEGWVEGKYFLIAIVKCRPLGLTLGGDRNNPTLAVEPISIESVLKYNGDGNWKRLETKASVADMFPATEPANTVSTEFNASILEK